jgi:hypothetical protein
VKRLSLGAFAALVVATVAAFFVTQHLKVTTPVVTGFSHPEAFSPGTCQPHTHISFYLQSRSDDVSLYVVDGNLSIVRTLSVNQHMNKGVRIKDGPLNTWNGREDNGQLAPDGTYYFRVALANQGRSIDLTNYPIVLKTVAPRPIVTAVTPAVIPNGRAGAEIHYKGNEGRNGTIHLYRTDLPGRPRLVKSFITPSKLSHVTWDGLVHGRPAPAGTYLVGLGVTDAACNTGHYPPLVPPPPGTTPHAGITVRYLAAEPQLDPAPAGGRALVYVDSRRRPYTWAVQRVGAPRPSAAGNASTPVLRVPLPKGAAGLYRLALRSGPYGTEVPLVASERPSARILVVLPALTWQGTNPGDEDGDGLPDTLDAGRTVQLQRPLVGGLPSDFSGEAAFLAYLDHAHLGYDLTTDLGLIDGIGPGLFGHKAIVFAGSERWLPSSLSGPLRTYVQAGGRVLSLGVDSMQRNVTVKGGQALNPGAPAASDALGAQRGPITAGSGVILQISDGLGIFSGTSGAFGSGPYQPVTGIAPPAQQVISAAGTSSTSPAIAGYRLGRGMVVDIGLVGFGSSLATSVDDQELIRRLWTVLES